MRLRRFALLAGILVLAAGASIATAARDSGAQARVQSCRPGLIGGKKACLKVGQKCLPKYDTEYHRFGFHCHSNTRLTPRTAARQTVGAPGLRVFEQSSLDAQGYIFIAPKTMGSGQQGPEIVDGRGRPVWFHPVLHGEQAGDFRVQNYRGKPVLTWWQGSNFGGNTAGTDYIVDSSYRVVAAVHAGNGLNADGHEFALTPQGTALITVDHEVPYDLSSVGGPKDGTAIDGVVQELDVETGNVLFEWHSLDHVPIDESHVAAETGYDYFHINAVNLDNDGNLLISARHTWTVYKVDRHTGQILWRLGGKHSDFKLGPGVQFAWQHNPLPAGENTIRLFDNETDGNSRVLPQSRVIWIHLDTANKTATLVKAIAYPKGLSVESQGNAQALENGDTFVGWGQHGTVSEFDPQGKLLFDAALPYAYDSYRAYRAEWAGQPDSEPTATALTNADGTTTVHAIWNGATAVAAWRILAGPNATALALVRTVAWNGLDTTLKIAGVPHEVEIVAIDARGSVIAKSKPVPAA
jgi:arylsulfotransferase ASST